MDKHDVFKAILLIVDQVRAQGFGTRGSVIGKRNYSDAILARVAGISTDVLCECPKHDTELISQLASAATTCLL